MARRHIRTPNGERTLLLTTALAAMLLPLNSTMIAIAIPDIVREHGGSTHATAWLVSGYLVVMASLLPSAGKLGDRFGRRRLILTGLALFLAASLGASLAGNLGVLILFRLLQAVAGAVIFPNALAVVREVVPEQRRGAGFGMLGAATALAAAAGPPLGGLLVAVGGWRAIFLINLPWAACAFALTVLTIPATLGRRQRQRFDWIGAAGLTAILVAFAWLLNPGGVRSWVVPVGIVALAVALLFFFRYELGHPDPVLQPRFLRVRPFAAATSAMGLCNLALYSILLAVPLLLSHRAGWSSGKIGLTLATLTAPMVAFSPVGGRLSDWAGRRLTAGAGLVILSAAMIPLALAGPDIGVPLLVGCLCGAGVGIGLATPALQAAGLDAVDADDAGVASGLFSTGRYLGGIIATSLVAATITRTGGADGTALFALAAIGVALAAALATALPGRLERILAYIQPAEPPPAE
jgi:EmrB/QacA subfamily drug resistance transporter